MSYDPPYGWFIDISTSTGRDIHMEVVANTGQEAVVLVMTDFGLPEGELIHMIHVSRPWKPSDKA